MPDELLINSKKILTVGDLHGKDIWEKIPFDEYDKIVFVGDYVDNYEAANAKIRSNLESLVGLKALYPDKVTLLLGNHDIQYLHYPEYRCSGFRPDMAVELNELFFQNREMFDSAYQYLGKFLWTHAGVAHGWLRKMQCLDLKLFQDITKAADDINCMAAISSDRHHLCDVSEMRGGKQKYGGIYWVDKEETEEGIISHLVQIVGHSQVPKITTVEGYDGSFTYVDCLDSAPDFLELFIQDDGVFTKNIITIP